MWNSSIDLWPSLFKQKNNVLRIFTIALGSSKLSRLLIICMCKTLKGTFFTRRNALSVHINHRIFPVSFHSVIMNDGDERMSWTYVYDWGAPTGIRSLSTKKFPVNWFVIITWDRERSLISEASPVNDPTNPPLCLHFISSLCPSSTVICPSSKLKNLLLS